jgi:SpoVK/Ycf46/Vps4 family AAA+-type ATPase
MPVDTNIKLSSVILSEENKDKIRQFINEISKRQILEENGLHPMNRILMYGDSGPGKTFLSKALTNYLNYTMLYVDIGAALNRGNISENLSNIFRMGNEIKECVIFLDECDSIGWNREGTSRESGEVRRSTNNLFQLMDQVDRSNIVIGCTNMLQMLDPAFVRRFDLKMEFFRPEGSLESSIRKFLFEDKGFVYEKDFDPQLRSIVERELSVSYYEIQGVVERAMKDALINTGGKVVKESTIYKMLAGIAGIDFNFEAMQGDL